VKNNTKYLQIKLCYPVESIFNDVVNQITNSKTDEIKYSNTIFYFCSDNKYVAEYDIKNNIFYCNYNRFWSKFKLNNVFNYYTIRYLLNSMVEEHFKFKGVTTADIRWTLDKEVEEHFKFKGVTTKGFSGVLKNLVKEHFKS